MRAPASHHSGACLPLYDAKKAYGDCDLLGTWGDICVAEPSEPRALAPALLFLPSPRPAACPQRARFIRGPITSCQQHSLSANAPLALATSELPQCASHAALCAKDKAWYFCNGGAAATTAKIRLHGR